MIDAVLHRAGRLEERGQPHVLATVVRVDRPVSAKPGDCALITADGHLEGWVGGSCSQPLVLREALAALADGKPRLLRLRPAGAAREDPQQGVVTEVTTCVSDGGLDVFVQPRLPRPRLVIAGSSPVARTLLRLAAALHHRAVVALGDPAESMPGVDAVLSLAELAAADLRAADAIVVATMSRYDEAALEAALATGAGYIGLVASRTRGAHVLELLRARGGLDEQVARVTTPAGLDLGPSGQDEIAVAILAEVVAHQNRLRTAPSDRPCAPGESGQTAVDPVCGMTIAVVATTPSARHHELDLYFCSIHCRDEFTRSPQRFERAGSSSGS